MNKSLTKTKPCEDVDAPGDKAMLNDLFARDSFSSTQGVCFDLTRMWHPRFLFSCFDVPRWLCGYSMFHYRDCADHDGNSELLARDIRLGVHLLYYKTLDNQIDRMQMPKALNLGETFALVAPRTLPSQALPVVAAITFVEVVGSGAVVLYLAVDAAQHSSSGFGSQLLMMLGKCLMHRDNVVKYYLKANPNNETAWTFL
jgi:hypothetical protein